MGGAARPSPSPPPPATPREGRAGGIREERRARRRVIRLPRPRDSASCCCRGAVTLGAGWLGATDGAAPPEPPSPPGLPSRPGAGRGAPPRWKCARRRPVAGRGAVPRRPHPRPRPRAPTTTPRRPAAGATGTRGGEERRAGGGAGRTGERERSAGKPPARPDARRRVESSGRTARTPPVYLLTVSRPLELSLQSSFQLSLTVLVDYRSRAGI